MLRTFTYQLGDVPPRILLNFLLVVSLVALAYAVIQGDLILAGIIVASPLVLSIGFYAFVNPRFMYLLYAIYDVSFIAIMRYIHKDGLSAVLDALHIVFILSILIAQYTKRDNINLKRCVNGLTLCYIIWAVFIIFQFLNPGVGAKGMEQGFRLWIMGPLCICFMASILSDTHKSLRCAIGFAIFFTTILFAKLMWQRWEGFDAAERYLLYVQGMARTHIISSGVRYFSFISDAANFGTIMGILTLILSITAFNCRKKWHRYATLTTAIFALIGVLMSGTRGALVIPLAGIALFVLICKSIRVFALTSIFGIFLFIFLAFTDFGNGNQFIRRARTIFSPHKDASYMVRVENRKEIAAYLESRPWGVGMAENIPKLWINGDEYTYGTIPPDSYMVSIWIQTGTIGLIIYLLTQAGIILFCCYTVMFRIKDPRLRNILAGFTGAYFGTIICGYVAYTPGQHPTNYLILAMAAFVINGEHIDKDLAAENAAELEKMQKEREKQQRLMPPPTRRTIEIELDKS